MEPNQIQFISGFTKTVLENRFHFCNKEMFQHMEEMCLAYFLEQKRKHEETLEYQKDRKPLAEDVIQRIQHYYYYSTHKQLPKMRFTKKEYEEAVGRLDEEEKQKIVQWLEEHGGYDKYIFNGFGG